MNALKRGRGRGRGQAPRFNILQNGRFLKLGVPPKEQKSLQIARSGIGRGALANPY